jgi:hypothetical protein
VLVNNARDGDSALVDRAEWHRTGQVLRTNVVAIAAQSAARLPMAK